MTSVRLIESIEYSNLVYHYRKHLQKAISLLYDFFL